VKLVHLVDFITKKAVVLFCSCHYLFSLVSTLFLQ